MAQEPTLTVAFKVHRLRFHKDQIQVGIEITIGLRPPSMSWVTLDDLELPPGMTNLEIVNYLNSNLKDRS